MTQNMFASCPDVTIANGQINSNIVHSNLVYEDALSISLFASAIDAARTYKFQISPDDGANFYDWTDGTNNITPPGTVSTASVYPNPIFTAFRITASGAVTGAVTWKMSKVWSA